MIRKKLLSDRSEWLKERAKRIGGSEAGCLVGANPYCTNVDLWELKTGRREADDLEENRFVRYGTEAEDHLRSLFALDYPEIKVMYEPNNLWLNDDYAFAHASLDGWLEDEDGRFGVLEIKTATISSPVQKMQWEGRIPDRYYCQVLWYMAITDASFAILKAQLKWETDDVFCVTRHYRIDREEVGNDIDLLMAAGRRFYGYVQRDEKPPLVLPEV